jgi:hypothetical protein
VFQNARNDCPVDASINTLVMAVKGTAQDPSPCLEEGQQEGGKERQEEVALAAAAATTAAAAQAAAAPETPAAWDDERAGARDALREQTRSQAKATAEAAEKAAAEFAGWIRAHGGDEAAINQAVVKWSRARAARYLQAIDTRIDELQLLPDPCCLTPAFLRLDLRELRIDLVLSSRRSEMYGPPHLTTRITPHCTPQCPAQCPRCHCRCSRVVRKARQP